MTSYQFEPNLFDTLDCFGKSLFRVYLFMLIDRKGKVMFSQVSVHNRSHGYLFTARPCYAHGAVGTHPTGMFSCISFFLVSERDFSLP